MPEKAMKIAQLVDLDILDETSKDLWNYQPDELIQLISALATGDDDEPTRSWINRHSSEFVSLDIKLVAIAPESATALLKQGHNLDLKLKNLADWDLAAKVIKNLSNIDKELASIVIRNNQKGIAQGFVLKWPNCNYKGLPEFIKLMSDLAPDVLKECLESLDPIIIKTSWVERLKCSEEEQQAAEALINLITDGNIASLMDVSRNLKNL